MCAAVAKRSGGRDGRLAPGMRRRRASHLTRIHDAPVTEGRTDRPLCVPERTRLMPLDASLETPPPC